MYNNNVFTVSSLTIVREAAKKVLVLVALRPDHPPPLQLSGNFFWGNFFKTLSGQATEN